VPREAKASPKTLSLLALAVGLLSWPCIGGGWLVFELSGFRTHELALVGALCMHVFPIVAIVLGHFARSRAKQARPPHPTTLATVGMASGYVLVLTPLACGLAAGGVFALMLLGVIPAPMYGGLPRP
jgi:hypothetical protein